MAEQINIAALRNMFNDQTIGTDQVVNGENVRITALSLRTAMPVPEVAAAVVVNQAAYGVGMNADLMAAFLRQNPIFERFVLANCGVLPFAGSFNMPCVPKAAQVLSYMRLRRHRVIEEPNRDGIAMYQAYGLCELFGPHLPDNHKLAQAEARAEIIATVHWFLRAEDEHVPANWFHVDLGLGNDMAAVMAITADQMTINQALVILEAIASTLPTSREWLNGISSITTVLTSLCKQGSVTNKAGIKIMTGVKGDHAGQEVILPERTVRVFHSQFARHINAENAEAAMAHYTAIIPNTSIRLLAIIEQAAESGMTVFSLVRRALSEHATFRYWDQAVAMMPNDFTRYQAALIAVGGNRYYGFNRNLGPAAANNFRSLGYLSLRILIEIGGDDALSRYGGLRQTIPQRGWIDHIVEVAKNEDINVGDVAVPTPEMQQCLAAIRGLLVNQN